MVNLVSIIAAICCLSLCHFRRSSSRLPWNWPILGMLPMFFINSHRIFDMMNDILLESKGTFLFKGAWFSNKDTLITSDPTNVRYVMSTNFSNYPKGPENKRFFDVFGDMLFNADHEEWRIHRKITQGFFTHKRFPQSVVDINQHTLEKGLIPVLDHVSKKAPKKACSLHVEFPDVPFSRAMNDANEAVLMRHIVPEKVWKLQRWLGIGREKKLSQAQKTLDNLAAKYIAVNREQLRKGEQNFNTLKYLSEDAVIGTAEDVYNTMRDSIIALLFAGRDTSGSALTWFFWLVAKNPSVESKIREELEANLPGDEPQTHSLTNVEKLNKLVYLHGALCEALRLFPPTPTMRRAPIQTDILPSGHHVNPKMKVVLFSYAIGRMEWIWGKDCLEFKPERWIPEKGGTNLVPSSKFLAFSTGPRICPGKDLAFIRMKAVAATIIHNYHVQVVETSNVTLASSFMLRMKDGLMVRVTKR
ncbi:cytochrome P450, family 96, subfamily A, polypeptide 4 [Actinidia rufa]|uniref:Cytochrome P450, family 96, subfamily A, polypeptide 4 n=1 Tax=Actinidia rufa TaxID=165716 RepID=A0A7J0E3Q4_9ERIC|nr:cytochrome P450, family 96, subfamily A, polypeptide 4 [Actinidia rufa]